MKIMFKREADLEVNLKNLESFYFTSRVVFFLLKTRLFLDFDYMVIYFHDSLCPNV